MKRFFFSDEDHYKKSFYLQWVEIYLKMPAVGSGWSSVLSAVDSGWSSVLSAVDSG